MPKVTERRGMRRSSEPKGKANGSRTYERHFLAEGYADESAARDALDAAMEADGTTLRMPTTINSAPLVSVELEEEMRPDLLAFVAKWELQRATGGGSGGGDGTDVYDFSFSASTVSFKATQSFETVAKYPATGGGAAPDLQGAIGVSEKGGVEGTDVVIGQWSEELTFYVTPETVTTSFKSTLFRLCGKVNNDEFIYFAPGECRLDGATGSRQNGGNYRITLKVTGQANETDIPAVDDAPSIPSKEGWDYLWYYRQPEKKVVTADVTILVARAKYAYIERVYKRASFAFLADITAALPGS